MGEDTYTIHEWWCDRCPTKAKDTRSSKPPDDWRWITWPSEIREESPKWELFCPDCYEGFIEWWDVPKPVASPKGASD